MKNEGNVVVDGVLAFCYGSFDHDLVHNFNEAYAVVFPEIMDWIFDIDIVSPAYTNFLLDIGR